MSHRRGFTLIELMVVVVIVAIIAAVIIPTALSKIEKHKKEETPLLAQLAPVAKTVAPVGTDVRPPTTELSDVKVKLSTSPFLEGFNLHTRYEATFAGTFVIRNQDRKADEIAFTFPFPAGIAEARNVQLRFREGEKLVERTGVSYSIEGIQWTGRVAPGEAVTVAVDYTVQGRDVFVYDVAGTGRSGSVALELALSNAQRLEVAPGALQPTDRGEVEGTPRLAWKFSNVITDKKIQVELPAGTSPLGRIILLCQLAGVAVLLYGAAFWYVMEGREPGQLDTFRLPGFLLLALDYSMFFLLFGVASWVSSSALAGIGVAAALSLPFLTLHVARLVDARFALGPGLAVAVFTLGATLAAVHFEEHRIVVGAGVAVVVAAYVTVTLRSWSKKRRVHFEKKEAIEKRAARDERVKLAVADLDECRVRAFALVAAARRLLETPGGDGRDQVEKLAEKLFKAATESELFTAQRATLPGLGDAEHETATRELLDSMEEAELDRKPLETAIAALEKAREHERELARLEKERALERERLEKKQTALREQLAKGRTHCLACGHAQERPTKHCEECGVARPVAVACDGCGAPTRLAVHLMKSTWKEKPLHCESCGKLVVKG